MVLQRYLVREIAVTFSAVILITVFVALSNKFIRLIKKVALGEIGPDVLMQMVFLQVPDLIAFLLPVALFLSILLAFGRLFSDQEIPVMLVCGVSWQRLVGICLSLGFVVFLVSGSIMGFLTPHLAKQREKLINRSGTHLLLQTLSPGRFHMLGDGKWVVYVANLTNKRTEFKKLFVAQNHKPTHEGLKTVITAQEGNVQTQAKTGDSYFTLDFGRRYRGQPGEADYAIEGFEQYQRPIPHAQVEERKLFYRTLPTSELWRNPSPINLAELQWRLSIPLAAIILSFLAVGLSVIEPRKGRYTRFFVGIVICIIYFNLLTLSKRWVGTEKLTPWIGLWWVHIILFLGAFIWLAHVSGRLRQSLYFLKKLQHG